MKETPAFLQRKQQWEKRGEEGRMFSPVPIQPQGALGPLHFPLQAVGEGRIPRLAGTRFLRTGGRGLCCPVTYGVSEGESTLSYTRGSESSTDDWRLVRRQRCPDGTQEFALPAQGLQAALLSS